MDANELFNRTLDELKAAVNKDFRFVSPCVVRIVDGLGVVHPPNPAPGTKIALPVTFELTDANGRKASMTLEGTPLVEPTKPPRYVQ